MGYANLFRMVYSFIKITFDELKVKKNNHFK